MSGNPMLEGMAVGTAMKRGQQLKAANQTIANLKATIAQLQTAHRGTKQNLEQQKVYTREWQNAHDGRVRERDRAVAEQNRLKDKVNRVIAERDQAVADRDEAVAERDQARHRRDRYFGEIEAMAQQARELAAERDAVMSLLQEIAGESGYGPELLQAMFDERLDYHREQNSAIEPAEYEPEAAEG